MTGPLSVRCPKCRAKLKLKSSKAVGKEVPCPKCGEAFVIKLPKKREPEPEPEDNFLEGLDEFGEEDYGAPDDTPDDDDEDFSEDYGSPAPQPARRGRSSSRRGDRKRSSQPINWQLPAMIAGGCLLVIALVVGVWSLTGGGGGGSQSASGNAINLAYLPPDHELVIRVRVADLWKAPMLQEFVSTPETAQGVESFREQVGLGPDDIESVTVGMSGLSEMAAYRKKNQTPGQAPDMRQMQEMQKLQKTLVVVRSSKAFDVAKFESASPANKAAEHEGTTYYTTRGIMPGVGNAAFLPDSKTLVMGTETEVKAAIERGSSEERRAGFDFVDPEAHVLFAMVPKDPSMFNNDSSGTPAFLKSLTEGAADSKMVGMALGVTLASNIDIHATMTHGDAGDGKVTFDSAEKMTEQLRSKWGENNEQFAVQFPKTSESIQKTIDSVSVKQDAENVVVSATVPASVTSVGEELQGFLPMMMMGGNPFAGASSGAASFSNRGTPPSLGSTSQVGPDAQSAEALLSGMSGGNNASAAGLQAQQQAMAAFEQAGLGRPMVILGSDGAITGAVISRAKFTEAGWEHLKKLTTLEQLTLLQCEVAGDDLKNLKGLANLKMLNIKGTKVPENAVRELQQALPGCTIVP